MSNKRRTGDVLRKWAVEKKGKEMTFHIVNANIKLSSHRLHILANYSEPLASFFYNILSFHLFGSYKTVRRGIPTLKESNLC